MKKALYSLRENWDKLQPYLDDPDVVRALDEAMTDFTEQYPQYGKWSTGDAPYKYTTSDYWATRIMDAVNNDEEYQAAVNERFYSVFGENADITNDYLWDELWCSGQLEDIEHQFYEKHSPKKGELEYYQFVHGCHWISQFVAVLLYKALGVNTVLVKSERHTAVRFKQKGVIYYADILNDWNSVEELEAFIGKRRRIIPVQELLGQISA